MKKSTFFLVVAFLCVATSAFLNFSGLIVKFEAVTYLMCVYGLMFMGVLAFMVGFELKIKAQNK